MTTDTSDEIAKSMLLYMLVIFCVALIIGAFAGALFTKGESSGRYERAMEVLYVDSILFSYLPENMTKVLPSTSIGTIRLMVAGAIPGHYQKVAVQGIVDYVCDGGIHPPFNSTVSSAGPVLP